MQPFVSKRFLDVRGVAEYLCLSEDTIRAWVRTGRIPYSKFGSCVRFDLRVIDKWADKKLVTNTVEDSLGNRLRNSNAPSTIRPEEQKDGKL